MKRGQMPVFMQAIYGSVLGVSSFNLIDNIKDNLSAGKTAWENLTYFPVLFNIVFFVMTLIIIAHDWFSYHDSKPEPDKKFWYYIGDIMAMFFMAQMFATATYDKIIYWYLFGIGYTICNFYNYFRSFERNKERGSLVWRLPIMYVAHFLITGLSVYLLQKNGLQKDQAITKDILNLYLKWIGGTFVAVVLLWWFLEKHKDKNVKRLFITIEDKTKIEFVNGEKEKEHIIDMSINELAKDKKTLIGQVMNGIHDEELMAKSKHIEWLKKIRALDKYYHTDKTGTFDENSYFNTNKEEAEFVKTNKSKKTEEVITAQLAALEKPVP